MDPLSTGRRQHQHLLASSLGSSGRAYGENDPRSATTSPIVRRDQGWILDTPSKINGRSPVTPKALSDPTDINEWMADFETPPRKAATQKDPHNIRECLFGFPPRVTEPVPSQASSQEGSFYSAQSSVIGEDDDHQKNIGQDGSEGCQGDQRNERSVGKVTDREEGQRVPSPRKPSSQAIGYDPTEGEQLFPRPQDTPSPLVQDTDQVQLSPVVSSVEHPYCAREEVPESSDDMFAEITSSAIHRAFSGKSDGSVSQNGRKSQGNRFISQRRLSRTSGDVSMHHIGSEDMEGLLEPWSLSSHGSNRLTGDGHVKHQLDQGLGDAYEDDFADLDGDHFDLHAFTQSPAKSRTIAQDAPVSIVTLDDNHETDEVNHQDGLKSDGNVIQARPAFILRPASVSSDTTAKWAKFFLDEDDDDAGMIGISEPLPGFGRFQVPSVSRPLSTQPMSDGESYVKNQNPSPRIASLRPITEEIHDATPPKFQGFGRFRGSNTFEPMAPISKEAQERAARLFDKDVSDDFSYHHTSQTTEPPKRSLPGFTNGHMKPVVPVSQEKMERWSRIFDDDDSVDVNDRSEGPAKPPPSFGGFSVASGKALPKLSESSLSKAANMLEVNDTPEVVSFSRPGQVNQFVGFSTAKNNGKTFVPITVSKAAQERALSVLEMEEPTSKPDHSSDGSLRGRISLNFNNRPSAPMKASSRNGVTPPAAPASVTSHPAPSTHMNNLKNKSLRSSASKMATALPGALKPLSRSTNQFKPPLMTNAGYGNHESIDSNMNDNNPTKPFGGLVGRKQIGKRALHPNARPTFVNPPQVQVTKVIPTQYRSLFNLEVSAERESISKFGLPQRRTPKELAGCGLPQDVIDMSLGTAKTFRLDGWGVSEAFRGLLDRGASAELLSEAWVSNHYGLIVWKLACYCRSWPDLFTLDKSLTPTTVLNQLCYRYEREINRAERSALRKVVEGDESASRHMVLCIAAIDRNANPPSVTVTDGWYVIPAVLDVHLHKAIQRGRLNVGSKLHVCQALLHGAENGGVAILEQPDAISIALHGNNTRLARWDKKLGFQRAPIQWTTRIRNILPDGGIVPGLDAVVLRKYPVVYMEKLENDTKIRRSGREEARAQEAHRSKMEKRHQEIVEEVEKELMPGLAQEEMLDRSTVEQEINARTSEMVAQMQRNVQAMFSIRVGNCHDDDSNRQEALITFWKADMPDLQEGQRVRLTSLKATKPSRDPGFEDMMQLNGTRNTISYPATAMEPDSILLTAYKPREITACADVQQLHIGAEIDLAVIVLAVSEVVNTFKKYLIVTDASRRLIVVEYHLSPISPLTSSSPPFWIKIMSKVLFANARYKIHDRKLDVDVVSCPLSYTQAVIASGSSNQGWPLYARRPLQQLHELESEDGHGDGRHGMPEQNDASLGQLIGRANAILMGMQPSL
ncbi:Breast cancer 2, early onset [Podila minutissima]|nr:Breast cancer 2, early onset [Podila minutissima]